MSLAGRGLLMTSMDVAAEHEAELNRWYDREHLLERVAIPGFVEARRYVAVSAEPKYLGLYSTEDFTVLSSPAYTAALANQTDWSKTNIGRFRNMGRAVARFTRSRGVGRGAALGLLRLRPVGGRDPDALRGRLDDLLVPEDLDGILSMHLVESDPALSVSLTDPNAADPGAADWYVLVDGSSDEAVAACISARFGAVTGADTVSSGRYRLLWDLSKAEL